MSAYLICVVAPVIGLVLFMIYNACRAGSNTSRDEELRELERKYHIINGDDV